MMMMKEQDPNIVSQRKKWIISNHREQDQLLQVIPKKGKSVSKRQDGNQTERMTEERT